MPINIYLILFWEPGIVLCVDSSTTASQGKMYSVNYPKHYGDNLTCTLTYHFNTTLFPPGTMKWVILDAQEFHMTSQYDYFRVVDDDGEHSYRGYLIGSYLCTSNFEHANVLSKEE